MSTIRASSQGCVAVNGKPPGGQVRPLGAGILPGQPAAGGLDRHGVGRTVPLAAACGSGSPGPAAPPSRLYQQSLTYSRCMRSYGAPDFPFLKQGPGGSLVHPASPPAGMLSAPGYDAAARSCAGPGVGGHLDRQRP